MSRSSCKYFLDKYPKALEDIYIISINDPAGPLLIEKNSPNLLTLVFHDTEKLDTFTAFNEVDAKEVIKFLSKVDKKKPLIIHCTAGISRSGAVGEFAAEFLGFNYLDFKKYNPQVIPNTLVKTTLYKVWRENDNKNDIHKGL